MRQFIDLKDRKFERLLVLSKAKTHITSGGNKVGKWNCVCDCGTKVKVVTAKLISGKTKSCGCYNLENIRKANYKHGFSRKGKSNILYNLLQGMKSRCYNKKKQNYRYYGARGISVAEGWIQDPVSFIEWALKNGYKRGLEIDRIDNNGNYEPSNCRFVTRSFNNANRGKLKNNTSGYTGVLFSKTHNRWISSLSLNNIKIPFGGFLKMKDALKARNDYIAKNKLPHKIQEWRGDVS